MTNGEKIKDILKPREDQIKIYGIWVEIEIQSKAINFSCELDWWNAEYKAEREDKQMNKLEKAKEVIKEHYGEACCGIFDCRNTVGYLMSTLYEDDDLTIDICYGYMYFEVFGLSETEFAELEEYYYSLRESEE